MADHTKKGNLFIAFKSLGDATGFTFTSRDDDEHASGIAGDVVRVHDVKALYAVSPLPGQFRLIREGISLGSMLNDEDQFRFL